MYISDMCIHTRTHAHSHTQIPFLYIKGLRTYGPVPHMYDSMIAIIIQET
jgi:hypothetical protein